MINTTAFNRRLTNLPTISIGSLRDNEDLKSFLPKALKHLRQNPQDAEQIAHFLMGKNNNLPLSLGKLPTFSQKTKTILFNTLRTHRYTNGITGLFGKPEDSAKTIAKLEALNKKLYGENIEDKTSPLFQYRESIENIGIHQDDQVNEHNKLITLDKQKLNGNYHGFSIQNDELNHRLDLINSVMEKTSLNESIKQKFLQGCIEHYLSKGPDGAPFCAGLALKLLCTYWGNDKKFAKEHILEAIDGCLQSGVYGDLPHLKTMFSYIKKLHVNLDSSVHLHILKKLKSTDSMYGMDKNLPNQIYKYAQYLLKSTYTYTDKASFYSPLLDLVSHLESINNQTGEIKNIRSIITEFETFVNIAGKNIISMAPQDQQFSMAPQGTLITRSKDEIRQEISQTLKNKLNQHSFQN